MGSEAISQIQDEMEKIPADLYIADGHHRAASAGESGAEAGRQENPDYTGEEAFNYFLSVVFPYDQLTILAYNRVVRDLNGQSVEDVLEKIKENFDMTIVPGFPAKPVEKHCFGMYLDGLVSSESETRRFMREKMWLVSWIPRFFRMWF